MNSAVDPGLYVVAKFPDGDNRGIDMDLLFKREQTPGKLSGVSFKLWGKIELNEDEQAIVKRYRFDDAVLIEAIQPTLIRNTLLVALAVFVVAFGFLSMNWSTGGGFLVGVSTAAQKPATWRRKSLPLPFAD